MKLLFITLLASVLLSTGCKNETKDDNSIKLGLLALAIRSSTTTDVYAGGFSSNSSNIAVAGYWKNETWTGLTPLDTSKTSIVNSITVSGSDVYAAGFSTNSSNVGVPGYWKNGTWKELTTLDSTKSSYVQSIFVTTY